MFDGDLRALADRLRRHPGEARHLRVKAMVASLSERWREAPDMLSVSDEVPVGAWVVRKKVHELLPRPEDPADEPDSVWTGAVPDWIRAAVAGLAPRLETQALSFPRPEHPARERKPAPVKAASTAHLASAWPRLRPPRKLPPVRVNPEPDPLERRLERLRSLLRERGRWRFPPAERYSRRETVALFLALLVLWHQGEVGIGQRAWDEPMEVEWNG